MGSTDAGTTQGWSGRVAAQIVGISYRQLDYWARTDLIRPSLADAHGSGTRRRYGYGDLLELKVVKHLLDAGIELKKVRKVFSYLRTHLGADIATANLVIGESRSVLVQTDGELIDVVRQGQGVLNVLPLGGVKDAVDAAILQLHPALPAASDAGGSRAADG